MASVPSDLYGYAQQASNLTGLNIKVILAQWIAENGWKVPSGYNFGNIMVPGTHTLMSYSSPEAGVQAYSNFLKDNSNYADVLATVGQSDQTQLAAIIASPWEETHYNGGSYLYSVYNSIDGVGANTGSSGGGSSASGGGHIVASDSLPLIIFFTILGGGLILMGVKIVTDTPISLGGR